MNPLDSQSGMLSRLMDAMALRQRVLSHNVANINTPGFKRLEVQFEETLQSALSSKKPGATEGIQPVVRETKGLPARMDGNTVDLDQEVGEMQRTTLLFQTYTQLLHTRLGMMRRAMESR
ncbi:MAG: flagellar basal body rod protein FlgB [Planctomyces sp.]|nr:flagellar basal body rod protein FlgB [Planctomyces sp.]